jgi:hypothetical protein
MPSAGMKVAFLASAGAGAAFLHSDGASARTVWHSAR